MLKHRMLMGPSLVLALMLAARGSLALEPGQELKAKEGASAQRPEYLQILKSYSNSVVTVRAVLRFKGGSSSNERAVEVEVPGVVIDSAGMVLCSNTMLGGMAQRMGGTGMNVVPTDIKILSGDDQEGLEARLMARDSELDLAWLQIKSIGSHRLQAIDLAHAVVPSPGDDLLTLQRMPKQYGRIPVITEGRAAGLTQKPRSMVLATGERGPGAPVFSRTGQFIGVSTLLIGEDDDRRGAHNFMASRFNTIVLPAAEVAKATARAKEPADTDGG